MHKKIISILTMLILAVVAPLSLADHHGGGHDKTVKGTVADLSWMTGSYSVAFGPNVLEENWITAENGTISSLVRMSGQGKTSMIELIVIEEEGDTLTLHIQQWDTGYKAREAGPQTMKLILLEDKKVGFEAVTPGGMKKLAYSRPTPDSFIISIEGEDGSKRDIPLKAK